MGETATQEKELVKVICHDFQGTLAPLVAWLHLLQREQVTVDQVDRAVDVIERSCEVLTRLATDLRHVITGRTADLSLTPVLLDLRGVVAGAVHAYEREASRRRVTIALSMPPVPVSVRGDRVRLAQVLANLVGNALKFTDDSGTIVVSLTGGCGEARLTVQDTGVGIGAGFLGRAFDKFSRERQRDRRRQGLGLGLHVVKRLVELHGGTVMADSAGRGRGSRFVITLPLAVADAA